MNALLGYGSSSSSDSEEVEQEQRSSPKLKLPKPTIGETALQTSVFSNPFVKEEMAKAAILEKHVKMVPGKDDTLVINGKKICWNYRKGRCRFGHNCKYAHDSDIQKSTEELDLDKKKYKSIVYEEAGTMSSAPPPMIESVLPTDDAIWEGGSDKKKLKRPGLSKGIVPSQKVLKMYKEQKLKDKKK